MTWDLVHPTNAFYDINPAIHKIHDSKPNSMIYLMERFSAKEEKLSIFFVYSAQG